MRLIILDSGEPCLSDILETDIPEESLSGFNDYIENMPNWTPGYQINSIARHVYVSITIKILSGQIDAVLY